MAWIVISIIFLGAISGTIYRLFKIGITTGFKIDTEGKQITAGMGAYLVILNFLIALILILFDLKDMILALVSVFVAVGTILMAVSSYDNLREAQSSRKEIEKSRRLDQIRMQLEKLYSPIVNNEKTFFEGTPVQRVDSRYLPIGYPELVQNMRTYAFLAGPVIKEPLNNFLDYDFGYSYPLNNDHQHELIKVFMAAAKKEYAGLLIEMEELTTLGFNVPLGDSLK